MISSFISNKIELGDSSIHGKGMFAKEDIEKDEIVFIKGGHILTKDQFYSSDTINSYLPLDDYYFLAATTPEEEELIKLFNNHSCEPNCGMRGEITFIAIRNIRAGEELTCDYAFIDNEDYEFICNCKTSRCRHTITGRDWMLPTLQQEYAEYFAVYLQRKFR